MSWVGDYFGEIVSQLSDNSSYITDSDNIVFMEEDHDPLGLSDSHYPRINILPIKLKSNGYRSQRELEFDLRYLIVGMTRRENDIPVFSDAIGIIDFAIETFSILMGTLDQKIAGVSLGSGFIQNDEYPEAIFDYEMFPRTNTFIIEFAAEFINPDTQET